MKELVFAARSDTYLATKDLYACRYCLELLPKNRFDDKMRGKPDQKSYCFECGRRNLRYKSGARIEHMGTHWVYCYDCKRFEQGKDAPYVSGPYCRQCQELRLETWRSLLDKEIETCCRKGGKIFEYDHDGLFSRNGKMSEQILKDHLGRLAFFEKEMCDNRDLAEVQANYYTLWCYSRKPGEWWV